MTRYRSQAHRTDPMHVLGIILFVVGAAIVASGVYFAFVLLASMAQYVPSLP